MTEKEYLENIFITMTKINYILEQFKLSLKEIDDVIHYLNVLRDKTKEGFALTLNMNMLHLLDEIEMLIDKAQSLKIDATAM